MLLLFAVLVARPRSESAVREPAAAVLRHLSLLFVPAGVGLIRSAAVLRADWVAIACAIVVSTAATMAVSALVFARVARALEKER
jgi:holin-like protein